MMYLNSCDKFKRIKIQYLEKLNEQHHDER